MSERPAARTRGLVGRTALALGAAVSRRDARALLVGGAGGYLLLYLATIGDLSLVGGGGGLSVRTVDDLSRGLQPVGFFRFEPVAAVGVAGVTYLLSPLNLLVGAVLALLVGANLSLTYLGLRQPRACGLEASTGVLGGVPALLAGAACCGPTFLLVVGIQASAAVVSVFQLLVPLAVVLLVASLLAIGRQVDPTLV